MVLLFAAMSQLLETRTRATIRKCPISELAFVLFFFSFFLLADSAWHRLSIDSTSSDKRKNKINDSSVIPRTTSLRVRVRGVERPIFSFSFHSLQKSSDVQTLHTTVHPRVESYFLPPHRILK